MRGPAFTDTGFAEGWRLMEGDAFYRYLPAEDFCRREERFAYRDEGGAMVTYDRVFSTMGAGVSAPLVFWVSVGDVPASGRISLSVDQSPSETVAAAPAGEQASWYRSQPLAVAEGFHKLSVRVYAPEGRFGGAILTTDAAFVPAGRIRHAADLTASVYGPAGGRSVIEPASARCGESATLTLTYTVGPEGLGAGGRLRISVTSPPWPAPQVENPGDDGYITVRSSRGQARVFGITRPRVTLAGREHHIDIGVDRPLGEGDQVVLRYGDRADGGAGVPAPVVPAQYVRNTKDIWFLDLVPLSVQVDPDGTGRYRVLAPERAHTFEVLPAEAASLLAIAPSRVQVGVPFAIRAVIRDVFGNLPMPPYTGRLVLRGPAGQPVTRDVTPEDHGVVVFDGIEASRPGTYTWTVADEARGWQAESNPVEAAAGEASGLYWGEIHAHCHLTDGRGTAASYYRYARDVAGLDFCSLSEHETYMSEGQWGYAQMLTGAHHRDGEFVTLVAYEVGLAADEGGQRRPQGHRCLYTDQDALPLYYAHENAPHDARRLRELLAGRPEVVVIPHHTLTVPTEWTNLPGEAAVEIYSMWGNSETRESSRPPLRRTGITVRELLGQGARLGFTAGGDDHDARPGLSGVRSIWGNLCYPSGLTAVLAASRTRGAILDAIRQRRTYGTTGARILMDVRLCGEPMGAVVTAGPSQAPALGVQIRGTADLARVEVVRDGEPVAELPAEGRGCHAEWTDTSARGRDAWYYVRMTQSDGEMAWCSPMWWVAAAEGTGRP